MSSLSYGSAPTSREGSSSNSEASSTSLASIVHNHESLGFPSENIDAYVPGGLHPVKLGSILHGTNTSYRVVNKLGSGSFATVWLVQYLDKTRWAAMKICRADSPPVHEVEILRHLHAGLTAVHLPALLDTFSFGGPNGTHTAVVTEVVATMEDALNRVRTSGSATLKDIVRTATAAVAHLHASGVAHGDLHLYNMALAAPELNVSDDHAYAEFAEKTDIFPVFSSSHDPDIEIDPGMPMYIVAPLYHSTYLKTVPHSLESPTVKLLDFGGARYISKPDDTESHCQRPIRPPEWLIGACTTASMAGDVWALGLAIYRIMYGGRRLYNCTPPGPLELMSYFLDTVPASWIASGAWKPSAHWCEPSVALADRRWASECASFLRPKCVSDDDAAALVKMLRRILVLDRVRQISCRTLGSHLELQFGDEFRSLCTLVLGQPTTHIRMSIRSEHHRMVMHLNGDQYLSASSFV
ncbi:kinase-like protein [Peniophora sp. CONT]|nr:kinase-like protein [Peniophora sp. CONT]